MNDVIIQLTLLYANWCNILRKHNTIKQRPHNLLVRGSINGKNRQGISPKSCRQRFQRNLGPDKKKERTQEENDRMLASAYASFYHWGFAGNALNLQRGHWLSSRVHAILGNYAMTRIHAQRCLEITRTSPDLMQDFDRAFAWESVARASSLPGEDKAAADYIRNASSAGADIKKKEDQEYFTKDFLGNDWGHVKPDNPQS